MQLTPTASVYFDKRYVNKSGLSQVTIMVCFKVKDKWTQKAYGTGIWLKATDYHKIETNKVRGELRSIANEINAKLAKATDILKLIPGITKDTFTSLFTLIQLSRVWRVIPISLQNLAFVNP